MITEPHYFGAGEIGMRIGEDEKTIKSIETEKQYLNGFKYGNLVKFKLMRLGSMGQIYVWFKNKFPYIIPDGTWNFGFTVWPIFGGGVIAGFIFRRKKLLLYARLCWGFASVILLGVAGLYVYLIFA